MGGISSMTSGRAQGYERVLMRPARATENAWTEPAYPVKGDYLFGCRRGFLGNRYL
jgi:hypothetical protein